MHYGFILTAQFMLCSLQKSPVEQFLLNASILFIYLYASCLLGGAHITWWWFRQIPLDPQFDLGTCISVNTIGHELFPPNLLKKKPDCLEDDDSQLSIYNPNEVQPTVPCSEAIRIKRGYHVLASPSLWGLNWRMQVTNVNVYNFWISWLELGQLQLESPKIRSV